MVRDLIRKDILKKFKIKRENVDQILDEAIFETEQAFGKTVKQLPSDSEAHEFLIEMVKTLMEEESDAQTVKKLVNEYCKSGKSFKDFIQEISISGDIGVSRSDLYDTTMVLVNNGTLPDQDFSNMDNDDRDKDDVWNTQIKGLDPKNIDLIGNVGDKGVSSDDYFGKSKVDTQDNKDDIGYEVSQHVKFHQQDSDEEQEGEVIGFENSSDPKIKKLIKIKVTKGSKAGKVLTIRKKNVKGRIKKDIKQVGVG